MEECLDFSSVGEEQQTDASDGVVYALARFMVYNGFSSRAD